MPNTNVTLLTILNAIVFCFSGELNFRLSPGVGATKFRFCCQEKLCLIGATG